MNGDITLNPVTIGTRTLDTSTQIMAPNQAAADAVDIQFYSDGDSFSLVFPYDFWNCPQEVVTASLLDSAVLIAPIKLDLESITGHVVVGDFNRLNFNQATMRAYTSKITLGKITIEGLLDLTTNNNDITLTSVIAARAQITNAKAAIKLLGFTVATADIFNVGGPIQATTFSIMNTADCTIDLTTSQNTISIDSLVFPTSGSCVVNLQTSNGNVTVSATRFAGSFEVSTSGGGVVSVPSHSCTSTTSCSGTVDGFSSHTLKIRTTNRDVSLNFQIA